MANELKEIPLGDWCRLRDLYTEHRDRASSFNTLQTFIGWKNKEVKFPLKIYALNGIWETDGTFVAEMNDQIFCNTLSDDHTRLIDALNCLDSREFHLMAGFQHRLLPAMEKHYIDTGLEKEQFHPEGTFWYHLSREKALSFTVEPPSNMTISSLDESNAEQINRIWPHRSDGSIEFVKTLIRLNKNVGLFDGDSLVAWCLLLPLGSLGLLQVEDAYKHKGLGSLTVRCISKWLAENNIEVTAPVVFKNLASRAMFEKLGFQAIDKVYWAIKSSKV